MADYSKLTKKELLYTLFARDLMLEERRKENDLQKATINTLIEDHRASQEWYKKQLAEKDEEIKSLRTRPFIDMTEKEMLELKIATHNEDLKKIKHIFNQDKIWFAVEQLEKVKEMLQPYLRFDINLYLQTIQDIDNQIKAIKEMK